MSRPLTQPSLHQKLVFRQRHKKNLTHENDPVVICLQIQCWNVNRNIVDPDTSVDVLYWDSFEGLKIDHEYLQPFIGSLVGLMGEHVLVRRYVSMITTFGVGRNCKAI